MLKGLLPEFRMDYPCHSPHERRWFSLRVTAIAGGAVIKHQDITSRKEKEIEREGFLDTLSRTEEIASIGGFYMDALTNSVDWTPGIFLIHDLDPSDIQGKNELVAKYLASASDGFSAAIENAKKLGEPYNLEVRRLTAKGREIWVHTHGEPVWRDGKVTGLVGHVQDITDRKETEEQLRASQKMEAVGQLTAGIAHDFNNLLAVISANLELLEEEVEGSPKLTKRVKAALKAVDRGADLTQHLLAFARSQVLSPKPANLIDVVQHSVRLITRTIPENITVQVMADPKAGIWVNVDEGRLENALLNLSLNARDAMPNGGILLFSLGTRDVGAGNDERRKSVPPGRYGVITVQDTGKGMSAEVMAKAFDPFFTTKQVGQGTGLGLSMVYGFVRQSGGRAHLTSTEGKGTTCTLLFPLVDGADKDATSGESAKAISKLIGPRKVLLVEDMADVRESIKTQLESLGLEVTTAEDATVGLEALLSSGQTFDLLLTDLGLPGEMDGDDLAKVAAEKSPGMKIITMSGYNKDRVDGIAMYAVSAYETELGW